jgi:hypothetical protein
MAKKTPKFYKINITMQYKGLFLYPTGMHVFAFRPPCPVECEAYSSGVSGKQKRNKFLATSASQR